MNMKNIIRRWKIMSESVGAGILNIITESLYDKPIVVFREYVQNSIDSFKKSIVYCNKDILKCNIISNKNSLYFLDNGQGISNSEFENEMTKIAYSKKRRFNNIGYKGIGRLSGISYCQKLKFINILSYKENRFQAYCIDCNSYNLIKEDESYNITSFKDLMNRIGKFSDVEATVLNESEQTILDKHKDMFNVRDTGFLVIMEKPNSILQQLFNDENIINDLGWLLPVNFQKELYELDNIKILFKNLSTKINNDIIPAESFNIYYNNVLIQRPISQDMLRDYTCKCNFEYAVGFHCFRKDRIIIEKENAFSGIRIYIDNMLLCDETELLPILQQYGLLEQSSNELLQSVRGIGAMIYITDKMNILANARRTFIEINSENAIKFLENIAEFINRIYIARYALSKYSSGKKNINLEKDKLNTLKDAANSALRALAEEKIIIDEGDENGDEIDFDKLSEREKKLVLKRNITKEFSRDLKDYLNQLSEFDYTNAYNNFKIWIREK